MIELLFLATQAEPLQVQYAILPFSSFAVFAGTLGLSYAAYRQQREAAENAKKNAEIDAELEEQEGEKEARERLERAKEQRRQDHIRRANIEAIYAKSGILLQGTPAQLLVEQTRVDELNTQNDIASINEAQKERKFRADLIRYRGAVESNSIKNSAKIGLFSNILSSFDSFISSGNLSSTITGIKSGLPGASTPSTTSSTAPKASSGVLLKPKTTRQSSLFNFSKTRSRGFR